MKSLVVYFRRWDEEKTGRCRVLIPTFDLPADGIARPFAGGALELPLHEPPVAERLVEHVLADVRQRRARLSRDAGRRLRRRGRGHRFGATRVRRVFRTGQGGAHAQRDDECLEKRRKSRLVIFGGTYVRGEGRERTDSSGRSVSSPRRHGRRDTAVAGPKQSSVTVLQTGVRCIDGFLCFHTYVLLSIVESHDCSESQRFEIEVRSEERRRRV